jgi:hypothetical protein
MAQRVDGHPPSDNSGKTRPREAPSDQNDYLTNHKTRCALLLISNLSFEVPSVFGICHSSFLLHGFESAILLLLD